MEHVTYSISDARPEQDHTYVEGATHEEATAFLEEKGDFAYNYYVTAWDADDLDCYGEPEILGSVNGEVFLVEGDVKVY